MIIGFEAKRAFHNRSGLGNYSRHLIQTLSRYQPQNKYLLYNPSPAKVNFEIPAGATEVKPGWNNKLWGPLWRQRFVSSRAKEDGVEVFHGLSAELPFGLKNHGISSVVTIHDLIFLRFPHLYKPLDRRIYLQKVRHACRVADKVVAVSRQTGEDLVEFLGIAESKIAVVYQGCAPLFWQDHRNRLEQILRQYSLPERFVLFVGTLEPRKNPHLLAKACAELHIPLVMVGRATSWWRDFLQNSTVSKSLAHIQVDSTEHLAALYQRADIFVYPSVFEGFGIPVLEAMASKCPVITGDNSALREVAGPGSLLVDVNAPNDLSSALQTLWKDADLRKESAKKNYEFANKFRDENLAEDWMKIYRNLR